jgi:hypothetical protein
MVIKPFDINDNLKLDDIEKELFEKFKEKIKRTRNVKKDGYFSIKFVFTGIGIGVSAIYDYRNSKGEEKTIDENITNYAHW